MTQTADGSRVKNHSGTRSDAVFVLVREERGSTDIRFIGAFLGTSLGPLPDVLRQIMRRSPSLLHLDLRGVDRLDDDGIKRLAHAVRICRRHGAMVKISSSAEVEAAVEDAGAARAIGILPRTVRDRMSGSPDAGSMKVSGGSTPRH